MALGTALSPDKIRAFDRETWAKRYQSLKVKMDVAQQVAVHTGRNLAISGVSLGSYSLALYARRRMTLSGKRVTFDAAGRIDGFFWPGLILAVAGSTPILKEAGPYVMAGGIGMMSAGASDFVLNLAEDHHKKAA